MTSERKQWFYTKIVFRAVFLIIIIYNAVRLIECRNLFKNTDPIKFTVVKAEIDEHRRGRTYELTVNYNSKEYKLDITKNIYYGVLENKLPDLYYSEKFDRVISSWQEERAIRNLVMISCLSLLTFIPTQVLVKLSNRN